jgi:hypothetical protein
LSGLCAHAASRVAAAARKTDLRKDIIITSENHRPDLRIGNAPGDRAAITKRSRGGPVAAAAASAGCALKKRAEIHSRP